MTPAELEEIFGVKPDIQDQIITETSRVLNWLLIDDKPQTWLHKTKVMIELGAALNCYGNTSEPEEVLGIIKKLP